MTSATIQIQALDIAATDRVAEIFVRELPGDFCSILGQKFLCQYFLPYFIARKENVGFIARQGNLVTGFVLGGPARGYYRRFIARHWLALAWHCTMTSIRNPRRIKYFVEVTRLLFGKDAFEAEMKDLELLYIAVDTHRQNSGTGGKLVRALTQAAGERGFERCIVKTMAEPEGAGRFYAGCGFAPVHRGLDREWWAIDLNAASGDRPNES